MKYIAWTVLLSGGLLLFACGDDTDSSSSSNNTTSTSSGGNTGSGGSGGAGGGQDCTYPPQMGDVCAANAEDSECVACTRSDCCMQVEACVEDEACTCVYSCFLAGCDPIDCVGEICPGSPAVTALTQCAVTNCPACTML